jgi:hypothetical protein
MSCSLVEVYRHSGGKFWLHLQFERICQMLHISEDLSFLLVHGTVHFYVKLCISSVVFRFEKSSAFYLNFKQSLLFYLKFVFDGCIKKLETVCIQSNHSSH